MGAPMLVLKHSALSKLLKVHCGVYVRPGRCPVWAFIQASLLFPMKHLPQALEIIES